MQPSLGSKSKLFGNWLIVALLSTLTLLCMLALCLIKSLLGSVNGIAVSGVGLQICNCCCAYDNDDDEDAAVVKEGLWLILFRVVLLSNVEEEVIGLRMIEVVSNWLLVLFDCCNSGCWIKLPAAVSVKLSGLLKLFVVGLFKGCSGLIFIFAVDVAAVETVLFDNDVT